MPKVKLSKSLFSAIFVAVCLVVALIEPSRGDVTAPDHAQFTIQAFISGEVESDVDAPDAQAGSTEHDSDNPFVLLCPRAIGHVARREWPESPRLLRLARADIPFDPPPRRIVRD